MICTEDIRYDLDVCGMDRVCRCDLRVNGIAGAWRKDSHFSLAWVGGVRKNTVVEVQIGEEQNSCSRQWYIPGRRKNL